MASQQLLADTNIEVGKHITAKFLGLTFNVDTIWASAGAGAIVVLLCFLVARRASAENPSRLQLAWEGLIAYLSREVESSLGKVNRYVLELSVVLFVFILLCNWLELIPTGDNPKYVPAPTADVNLTYALGIFVIVGVHIRSVRVRGFRGYLSYYAHGPVILRPLTVLEEIVKPFTLALRLFGNIFAGGIMLAIIGLIPVYILWLPNLGWKLIDMAIGVIQAFIFALLTVIYFGMMSAQHDAHDAHDVHHPVSDEDVESDTQQHALSGAH